MWVSWNWLAVPDWHGSGVATQLDVIQAERDAFAASVARIQSDAELAYARAALRLDAGRHDARTLQVFGHAPP